MIKINEYINKLIDVLSAHFDRRLIYVGLQGSYLRGEADENSDIDIMIVLDSLQRVDLDTYRSILQSLEHYDRSCGFICSKDDLRNWNPLEICHLLHTTKDYHGKLLTLVPTYKEEDIRNYIKLSINNLYHAILHHYIHANHNKDIHTLSSTFKGVFFILQNIHYLNTGIFTATKAELLQLVSGSNFTVLKRAIELNDGVIHDFNESFDILLDWCQEALRTL